MSHDDLHPDLEALEPDSWDPATDRDEGDRGVHEPEIYEALGPPTAAEAEGLDEARAAHSAAPNPSGLSDEHRVRARDLAIAAGLLAYHYRDSVHYTQAAGPRWQGIHNNLKAFQGEYPKYADCSSYATWCLWNGLDHFGVRDVVNGLRWAAGYTGTMLVHGARASEWVMRGDCAIYGTAWPGHHTALCVGGGMVLSHGSERGPLLLPLHYRGDLLAIRRYI